MDQKSILLVEDTPITRAHFKYYLSPKYTIYEADDISSCMHHLKHETIDLVLLDLNIKDAKNFELFDKITAEYPQQNIIIVTSENDVKNVVNALKKGAKNYLFKGDVSEDPIFLLKAIDDVFKQQSAAYIQESYQNYQQELEQDLFLPEDSVIPDLYDCAIKAIKGDLNLFIGGEPGTGKHTLIHTIHRKLFAISPLVVVDCNKIEKDFSESEFFEGQVQEDGTTKPGKLEFANNGILVLREVTYLNKFFQERLCDVLKSRQLVTADGREVNLNFHLVCTSSLDINNPNITQLFTTKFLQLITQYSIKMPSLADNKDLIESFATYFIERFENAMQHQFEPSELFMDTLKQQQWRGNIRELKDYVKLAILQGEETLIPSFSSDDTLADLEDTNLQTHLQSVELNNIKKALKESQGNISAAARKLNLHRSTFQGKLRKYQLNLSSFKS